VCAKRAHVHMKRTDIYLSLSHKLTHSLTHTLSHTHATESLEATSASVTSSAMQQRERTRSIMRYANGMQHPDAIAEELTGAVDGEEMDIDMSDTSGHGAAALTPTQKRLTALKWKSMTNMHNSFSLLNEVRTASPSSLRGSAVSPAVSPCVAEPSLLRALVLDSQMSEEMRDGEAIKSLLRSNEEEAYA